MDKLTEFAPFFYPKSVAAIGATPDEQKPGSRFFRAMQEFGFKGKIYPVNPGEDEIYGLKAYRTVRDIPDPIDFVHISVPARAVPRVLEDCVAKGVKAVVVFTAGFRETGEDEGRRLEAELMKIAQKGIRIIGPNCFGIHCPASGLTFLEGFSKESGPVGFISQSGGQAAELGHLAKGWGIRISKMISYGNACDVNESDSLEYLAQDPETKIIGAYIEGVRHGRHFLRLLKQVSKTKPVIIWKAGLTQAGSRAVNSHTGSLGGEQAVWEAVFKQSGAISVRNLEELVDTIVAFLHLPSHTGQRIGVIGGGGGIGAAAADALERVGLAVPVFIPEIQQQLKAVLPPAGNSVRNPVDVGSPMMFPEMLEKVASIVGGCDYIDVLIVTQAVNYLGSHGIGVFQEDSKILVNIKEKFGKPVIVVLPELLTEVEAVGVEEERREIRDYYFKAGIPSYPTLERAARALADLVHYHERIAAL